MTFYETSGQMTEREKLISRACQRDHRQHWAVIQRKGNASAFNGYRWQPSDYSLVRCNAPGCERPPWRTKAAYVDNLPDAEAQR